MSGFWNRQVPRRGRNEGYSFFWLRRASSSFPGAESRRSLPSPSFFNIGYRRILTSLLFDRADRKNLYPFFWRRSRPLCTILGAKIESNIAIGPWRVTSRTFLEVGKAKNFILNSIFGHEDRKTLPTSSFASKYREIATFVSRTQDIS